MLGSFSRLDLHLGFSALPAICSRRHAEMLLGVGTRTSSPSGSGSGLLPASLLSPSLASDGGSSRSRVAFALRAFSLRLREVEAACLALAAARAGDSRRADPRGDPHLDDPWGELLGCLAGEGLLAEARDPPCRSIRMVVRSGIGLGGAWLGGSSCLRRYAGSIG